MRRVWFNKTFSSVHAAIGLIRQADGVRHYHLLASNTNPHSPALLAADEAFVEPTALKGMPYVDWCVELCRTREIDIFVPGKEAALIALDSARFAQSGTRVLSVAEPEVLHLLHDKARFYQAVEKPAAGMEELAGLAATPAQFEVVENIAQFDAAYARLRADHGKLCIKPSVSVYGLGFALIDEQRNAAQLLIDGAQYQIGLDDLRRGLAQQESFKTMLLMEYLDGHEYSVDCVGECGRLVCAVPRKKSLLAGHGQVIDLRADLLSATEHLVARFRLNGVFNVQFREGRDGLRLLEINPRMSGGIGMACLAGPNLPYLALAGFDHGFDVGNPTLTVPPVREGMRVGETSRALVLS